MKKPGGDGDGDADGDVHGGGVTGRHYPAGFSSLPTLGAPPEKNPPEPEASHGTHEQHEKKPEASHIGGSSDSARIEQQLSPCIDHFISTRQGKRRRVKISWACIRFSNMTSPEATGIFLNDLRNTCVKLGMDFTTIPAISAYSDYALPTGIEETLQELYEFNNKLLRGKQLGLLIVILPDDRIYDEKVEEACKELGFTYHCFSPQDAMMPRQEYLDSAAHEINKKVKKRQDSDSTELCELDEDMGEYCASSFDEEM